MGLYDHRRPLVAPDPKAASCLVPSIRNHTHAHTPDPTFESVEGKMQRLNRLMFQLSAIANA
jgi:hypothetical protein